MDRSSDKRLHPALITLMSGLALLMLALPNTAAAATVAVDCDAGGKVQAAVDSAHPGDTIQVSGVCNESVRFNDEVSRITLDGKGLAAIHGPSATSNTILIRGRGITVKGFTITGGLNGVTVLAGGTVLIQGNTIQATAGIGINVAQHSYARIVGNIIQSNPGAGIRVLESSFARIGFLDLENPVFNGNVIQRNGAEGVLVQRSSGASLVGNTISENDGPGVLVSGTSHGDLASNNIDANSAGGVVVAQNSDVQLGGEPGILAPPNDTALPNGGFGLTCLSSSSIAGSLGTLAGVQGVTKFDSSCSNGPKIK
jgi:parallel beta-helix repeat protein